MMPVGTMGATINLESMRLEIPEGALGTSTMLTVTSSTEAPPAGLRTLAPIYRFGPEGTTFREPIAVSFALPTVGTRPRIYWTAPGGSTFEATGTWLRDGRLYARVSHFSAGTCVDTMSSALHCGVCDNACQPGQTCLAGTCLRDCTTLCVRSSSCPGADAPRCLMECQSPALSDACFLCLASLTDPCDRSTCTSVCPL